MANQSVSHIYKPWCSCEHCSAATAELFPGYRLVESESDFQELLEVIRGAKEYLSFDYETFELTNDYWLDVFDEKKRPFDFQNIYIAGCSFSTKPGEAWYMCVNHKQPSFNVHPRYVREALEAKPEGVPLVAHNAAFEDKVSVKNLTTIDDDLPFRLPDPVHDTMFMAFTVNELQKVGLKDLTNRVLGKRQVTFKELLQGCNANDMSEVTGKQVLVYGGCDADWTGVLYTKLQAALKALQVAHVMPIDNGMVHICADMAFFGVNVDIKELRKQLVALQGEDGEGGELGDIKSKISQIAGYDINLDSPVQLSKLLYVQLGLTPTVFNALTETQKARGMTKGTASTNNEALVNIRGDHEIVPLIMRYRDLAQRRKLILIPWLENWHPDTGHVHGDPSLITNDDLGLSTGRMAYHSPNPQQLPKRGEKVECRRIIIPDVGHDLVSSSDFSQIELRILAHLSQDQVLLEAYRTGKDVHTLTASRIFGKELDQVSKGERFVGKTTNFAVVYGAGAGTLMRIVNADAKKFGIDVHLSPERANEILRLYFRELSGVAMFIEAMHKFAHKNGYVKSMFGRKFNLPYVNSGKSDLRSKAERKAVNSPIQGSAGELMKRAAIRIFNSKEYQEMLKWRQARLIMMIHDELVFSHTTKIEPELKQLVTSIMADAPKGFTVPISAGWSHGPNFCDLEETK